MDPVASTGFRKAMSTSYSLFSDFPLNLSVSSSRTMDASFTSEYITERDDRRRWGLDESVDEGATSDNILPPSEMPPPPSPATKDKGVLTSQCDRDIERVRSLCPFDRCCIDCRHISSIGLPGGGIRKQIFVRSSHGCWLEGGGAENPRVVIFSNRGIGTILVGTAGVETLFCGRP